jgi:hypothetical protein
MSDIEKFDSFDGTRRAGDVVCNNVTDMLTRQPYRTDFLPSDSVAAQVTQNADSIYFSALKIRALAGLDLALRALQQAADDIRAAYRRNE